MRSLIRVIIRTLSRSLMNMWKMALSIVMFMTFRNRISFVFFLLMIRKLRIDRMASPAECLARSGKHLAAFLNHMTKTMLKVIADVALVAHGLTSAASWLASSSSSGSGGSWQFFPPQ